MYLLGGKVCVKQYFSLCLGFFFNTRCFFLILWLGNFWDIFSYVIKSFLGCSQEFSVSSENCPIPSPQYVYSNIYFSQDYSFPPTTCRIFYTWLYAYNIIFLQLLEFLAVSVKVPRLPLLLYSELFTDSFLCFRL